MPWTTPTLRTLRQNARSYIMAALQGADALIPNSVLRVMADVNAGLAHLVLQFIEWLANELLPITSTDEWLDRWATLYLLNSDGSKGRKQASFSSGTLDATVISPTGATVAQGTIILGPNGVSYQVTEQASTATAGTLPMQVVSLTAGAISNLDTGATLSFGSPPVGMLSVITVVTLTGGADTETDDQLRYRLLLRLANPPMGGNANDYVQWALAVPGVTRAWASPEEMGPGTMTIRFMCDSLRAANNGFPTGVDITAVQEYIDTVRPVTVKDFFVVPPIATPINFTIKNLVTNDSTTQANIEAALISMLLDKAAPAYAVNGISQPAQTIYVAWIAEAILSAAGVDYFDLYDINGNAIGDFVMPNDGSLATLGTIVYG